MAVARALLPFRLSLGGLGGEHGLLDPEGPNCVVEACAPYLSCLHKRFCLPIAPNRREFEDDRGCMLWTLV